MKISPVILGVAIVVAALLGFFIGKNTTSPAQVSATKSETKAKKKADTEAVKVDAKETDSETETTVSSETEAAETGTTPPKEEVAELEEKEVPKVTTTNPTAAGDAVLKRMIKGISDDKLSAELVQIAESLEAQKLAYVSSKGQDCSGIFHKIKDMIQKRIPALAQKADYQYPEYSQIRSSRQIANWFHERGNLLIVEDPLASRNSIRPGTVMFYGKPNKKFKNMTIEQLTDKDNNFTSNGYIMHIAVVTDVRTDEDGNVTEYTIMHGRNSRYPASRTGSKEVQSTRTKGLPAFGNWSQQWVAAANIATSFSG